MHSSVVFNTEDRPLGVGLLFFLVQVMNEFVDTVMSLDADSSVRSIIVTGRGKAFAAGADIKEMVTLTQHDVSCGSGHFLVIFLL